MRFRDIISCGIQDLRTQRRKNRASFILIFLSLVVYIGVNSTIEGMQRGVYDVLNGHSRRILILSGNDDVDKEYEYLSEKYGDDERVQEIFVGGLIAAVMVWENAQEFLGVEKQDMFFSTCYESVFDYDYKGEKRMPGYNEIILPRYMYSMGIYTDYTYANGDELIGKTITFKNESYGVDYGDEYKLKVIGTYDNITKIFGTNYAFANNEFIGKMMDIERERKEKAMIESNGGKLPEGYISGLNYKVYMFIKEGYDINKVYDEIHSEVWKETEGAYSVEKFCELLEETKSYYNYIITVGNIVSFMLLFVAVINILISSISEVKERNWEFALKMAMGYVRGDIIKIFAVEKIANVLKALVVSVIVLMMYGGVATYYYRTIDVYWKRSYVIRVEPEDVFVAMILVVMAALMGVFLARYLIKNVNVAKSLKAGE